MKYVKRRRASGLRDFVMNHYHIRKRRAKKTALIKDGKTPEEAENILQAREARKRQKREKAAKRARIPEETKQQRDVQASAREANTGQGRDQLSVRRSAGRKARGGRFF